MKIVKYLFFLLLIFIIAGSIYVATKEGDYKVEESLVINAPKGFVFSQVNDFKNWETWGPWASGNNAEASLSSVTAGEGANLSWRNEEKGPGSVTIVKSVPNDSIVQTVSLDQRFGTSDAKAVWKFQETENGTLVSLQISGEMDFKEKLHWEMTSESLEGYFKPMFEKNLLALSADVDRQMKEYDIKIHGTTEYGGGYYMYSSTSARQQNVQEEYKEMLPQIKSFMEENNISDNGRPFILYHNWDDENGTALFSVAIPTPTKVVTPTQSNVVNGFMPRQTVVRTTLKGSRKNLPEAWEAAFVYIEENNLVLPQGYKPFEVYISDEEEIEVPAFLITEIYIPVEEQPNPETQTGTRF